VDLQYRTGYAAYQNDQKGCSDFVDRRQEREASEGQGSAHGKRENRRPSAEENLNAVHEL